MATEKTTATPAEVQVSANAEDMLNENVANAIDPVEEQAQDEAIELPTEGVEEALDEDCTSEIEPEDVAVSSYADKSKEEIVAVLEDIVANADAHEMRAEVESLKIAFYKRHRAEADALRKAFVAENGEEAEYVAEPDALETKFKELLKAYRAKRDAVAAETEKIREENYRAKLAIIEEIKTLINGEETLNSTFVKFHELQTRWKEIGAVPQQCVKDLWETYNLHVENFYDYVKINKELRDLDWKKNLETKTALCEQAEALSDEKSAVEAFRKLQKLHEEWRETGPVAGEFKESLWERFKEASSAVNRRHQEFFEGIKSEQIKNLELKTALCEKVEAMIADEKVKTHKAWNKASERLMEIQREWRTIGFAPKKDNTKVYERFRKACDAFFEAKRAFYADVKGEMEENLRLKEALCEAAEKLQDSEAWKEATDQILELQAKWKEIGAVSRRHSDTVWKRFRAACDRFFERKSAYFASQDSEQSDNLSRKNALIDEMNAADVKAGGHELIKSFQRRWNEIGYVPIKHKDELQKRYKAALDNLFGVLRGSDRETSMARFRDKVTTMRQSGDRRLRSERERLYNRVRQLEQEIIVLENNIGFFAKSKGAESLKAEVEEKIARAKREIAEAVEKVKLIDNAAE